MKQILSILLTILISLNILGQKKNKYSNIEDIKTKFAITMYYVNQYSFIKINSRLNDNAPSIYYKPNVKGGVGAKVKIKNISIAYTFKLPQDEIYGNTRYTDINFNYMKHKFGFSLYYLNYKGLYIKNPDDISFPYNKYYPFRDDIRFTGLGFATNFAFMKSFSVNAAIEQTERQKKTAGSFLLLITDRFSNFKSDSSFIPFTQKKYYDKTNNINKMNVNTFKIAPGVGYSFIIDKFFSISSMLYTGWGFQMKFYKESNKTKFGLRLPFYVMNKSAIGYNGKNIFINFVYSIELNNIRYSDSDFKILSSFLKFSVGYRILEK